MGPASLRSLCFLSPPRAGPGQSAAPSRAQRKQEGRAPDSQAALSPSAGPGRLTPRGCGEEGRGGHPCSVLGKEANCPHFSRPQGSPALWSVSKWPLRARCPLKSSGSCCQGRALAEWGWRQGRSSALGPSSLSCGHISWAPSLWARLHSRHASKGRHSPSLPSEADRRPPGSAGSVAQEPTEQPAPQAPPPARGREESHPEASDSWQCGQAPEAPGSSSRRPQHAAHTERGTRPSTGSGAPPVACPWLTEPCTCYSPSAHGPRAGLGMAG